MRFEDLKFGFDEAPVTYGYEFGQLNFSSVYTKLIKEAAGCECYASDLLIDLNTVVNVQNGLTDESSVLDKLFVFGFRDMGVDHDAFVRSRLEDNYHYRSIYLMQIRKSKHTGRYNLYFKRAA